MKWPYAHVTAATTYYDTQSHFSHLIWQRWLSVPRNESHRDVVYDIRTTSLARLRHLWEARSGTCRGGHLYAISNPPLRRALLIVTMSSLLHRIEAPLTIWSHSSMGNSI